MLEIERAKELLGEQTERISALQLANQRKVLKAFHNERAGSHCFADSTGYGYSDLGREHLERIYARVFGAPSALVRPQIVSGTHAIYTCLSLLSPGDKLVSLSGTPYDTLLQVIGLTGKSARSLIRLGVEYQEVDLAPTGGLDFAAIEQAVTSNTRMVMIQRSPGYRWRPSVTLAEMERAFAIVKKNNPSCICFVDNCYGEFVNELEPPEVGADLIAGSLIKNPGGGLASGGGYIVGSEELVHLCAENLTAPGLGRKVGPTYGMTRPLMQGLFLAPHVVGEALYGSILMAAVFEALGYQVLPKPKASRSDIVQAIRFEERERLLAFCQAIQEAAPIDNFYEPIPDEMPGYDDPIVMAAGTFIQGSSIELSADAPLRHPYIAFYQGGLTRQHAEIAVEYALRRILAFC